MFFTDQMRSQFGQLAFTKVGKAMKQFFGRNQPQNGVAQKLKLLVVSDPSWRLSLQRFEFASLGAMSKSLLQQLRSREWIAQSLLQFRNVPRFHDLLERICLRPFNAKSCSEQSRPVGWTEEQDSR